MFLSLKTQKQRITAPNGTIYYAENYSTLHAVTSEGETAVALNLKHNNWSVSELSELFFVSQGEDGCSPQLWIVDPARHQAITQSLSGRVILDLCLLGDAFVANIPGYLLLGKRAENGSLQWRGMRMIAAGAGFHFRSDGRDIWYTRRGSSRIWCYHRTTGITTDEEAPEVLWDNLFKGAFQNERIPDPDPEKTETLEGVKSVLLGFSEEIPLTAKGIAVYAILCHLEDRGVRSGKILPDLVMLDWREQYDRDCDEPFPIRPTVDILLHAQDVDAFRNVKINIIRQHKWCMRHEKLFGLGRNARLIQPGNYTIKEIP